MLKENIRSQERLDAGAGGPKNPPTEKTIKRKGFFLNLDELTNQHIVERGIATGLIKHGESAKDVAKKLAKYDPKLGEFMDKVIEQNTSRKRGGIKKNAYMTGKNTYTKEMIKNPNGYLQYMSNYITNTTNSKDKEGYQEWTETIKTLFGHKQESQSSLYGVFDVGSYPGFKGAMEYLKSDKRFEKLVGMLKNQHDSRLNGGFVGNGDYIVMFVDAIQKGNKVSLYNLSKRLGDLSKKLGDDAIALNEMVINQWGEIANELKNLITAEMEKK